MKEFETPEIEKMVFKMEDILTISGDEDEGYEPGEGGVGGGMGM